MQEINSMESQAEEHSSRETQLEREILKLKKENENLKALNIALQQGIIFFFMYFCLFIYILIYQSVWLSVSNHLFCIF